MASTTYADPVPPLSDGEKQAADDLYTELKPVAQVAAHNWVMAHIPPRFMAEVGPKVDGDFPLPAPPA